MKKEFQRIFDTGWTNFKRNSYLSFGTTGVMALVLLLFAGLLTVNYISSQVVTGLENKVDVTAYFKQAATEDEIMSVQQDLENQPNVQQVTYVSQDQAL